MVENFEKHMQEFRGAFALLDASGSGKLQVSKVEEYLNKLGIRPGAQELKDIKE